MSATADGRFFRGVPTASAVRKIVREEIQAALGVDLDYVRRVLERAKSYDITSPGFETAQYILHDAIDPPTHRRRDGGNE